MGDEIDSRFKDLHNRIDSMDKRISDVKWQIGGVAGIFTLIFGILTIVFNMNFNSEKAALREFQRDLKTEIGKIEATPELALLGTDGSPLANQVIPSEFLTEEDGTIRIKIKHFLKNNGTGKSGPLYIKFYTREPIKLESPSTDEPEFDYEAYVHPINLRPSVIPGNYSVSMFLRFNLKESTPPPRGTYPALLKVFYGKGDVVDATFKIVVD